MTPIRAIRFAILVTAALVAAGGCQTPKYEAKPDVAKALLERVLDDWKKGVTVEALRQEKPPIYVADERWLGGATLTSYTIRDGQPFGASMRYVVAIEGPPPVGSREVVYLVSTEPAFSVALGD